MKYTLVLFTIILFSLNGAADEQYATNGRHKRTLIWPEGGSKLLAICGFGVPVDLESETVIFGVVFKGNYRYPTNATEVTDPVETLTVKKRALTRWYLYDLFTQAMDMRGFNGKPCLLRIICEIAKIPLVKNLGIFHELIHTFFTPTSTKEKVNHHTDNEYYAAQMYGQKQGNCGKIFKECSFNFVDFFTLVHDIKQTF